MCGIAGLVGDGTNAQLQAAAVRMRDGIAHRGPDGAGVWVDRGVALAHRRLAILDLSEHAAQPMMSRTGRFVLTYNGEVYNYRALRDELSNAGVSVNGTGDTEVVLAAMETWGVREALDRFVGMFAIALWDREKRTLTLARDRLGIKPLYVARKGGRIVFGSELTALERAPGEPLRIDRDSLAAYFRYACLPAGRSIYEGVQQVPPGTLQTYYAPNQPPEVFCYWSALEIAKRGLRDRTVLSESDAVDLVETLLSQAVTDRLVSDVPVGVFLSGGIDSSTVAALMQQDRTERVKTFSIGFQEKSYDEADDARLVAQHLGTDHTELTLTPREAMRAIPELASVYCEPFADSSQLPTLLVCRLAREHVTVALSGDGGDEVFGGYNRHLWAPPLWRGLRNVPMGFRNVIASGLASRSSHQWDTFAARYSRLVPLLRHRTPGDKIHKLAGLLVVASLDELYLRLTSIWPRPSEIVHGVEDVSRSLDHLPGGTPSEQLMFRDLVTYLPDDILTKVDRASMSVGLEVRVPLIDHRIVEAAWQLPPRYKLHKGVGKRVLRRVLARHVPEHLFERPKMGFGVPLDHWLRGPLRDWAEDLISDSRVRQDGYLNVKTVRACWTDVLQQRGARQHQMWAILMFQAWLDRRSRPS